MEEGFEFEFDLENFLDIDKSDVLCPKEEIQEKLSRLKTISFIVKGNLKCGRDMIVTWLECFANSLKHIHKSKLENFSLFFKLDWVFTSVREISLIFFVKNLSKTFPCLKTLVIDINLLRISTCNFAQLMYHVCDNFKYLHSFTFDAWCVYNNLPKYWRSVPFSFLAETSITTVKLSNNIPKDEIDLCRLIENDGPMVLFNKTKKCYSRLNEILRKNRAQRIFFNEIFFILYIGVKKRLGLLRYINKDCVSVLLQFLQPHDVYHDCKKDKQDKIYAAEVIKARNEYVKHVAKMTLIDDELKRIEQKMINLNRRKVTLEHHKEVKMSDKKQALVKLDKIIKDGRGV